MKIFSLRSIFFFIFLIFLLISCNNEKKVGEPLYPETTATPPGGNYPARSFPVVALESNKPATIYYTLNGELPEIGRSYTYSGRSPVTGIEIRIDTTLRFFAIDDDGNQESVKTEVYTIDQPPLTSAAPRGGTFNKPVRVTLVPNEEGTIYYTLDGSTPTTGSFVYTAPVLISKEGVTVLKFFSLDLSGNQEDVKTEQYIIDYTPPETRAIPSGGRYPALTSVTLLADEQATIYYRHCQNEYNPDRCPDPILSDPDVSLGDTTISGIEIGTGVLKYFAIDRAGNQENTKMQVYLTGNSPYTSAYPSGGLYRTPQLVQLYSDVIPGATAKVYYTTDGSTPDLSSPSCLSPCSILIYTEGITELKFFAQDSFGNTEALRTEVYTIDSISPTTSISPSPGEYIGPQSITLSSSEPATIYYTLDGSTPEPGGANTLSGTSPVSGIVISTDKVIKFMSIDLAGNVESVVNSATYSILYKYTETFNDNSYKDVEKTTGEWDTDEGVLKLSRAQVPVLKTISTGGTSYGIEILGNYLFLADGSSGLKIYDISFPSDPQLAGIYPAQPGEVFYSVRIKENIAYCGTSDRVVLIDISDPRNPLFDSQWNLLTGEARDLLFYGGHLLVAAGSEGLWVMGEKNIPLYDTAVSLAIYGSTLYVADTQGDVKVIDMSVPSNPLFLMTVSVPGSALSLEAIDGMLFVGTDNGVLYKFNIKDPEKPVFVSSLNLSSQINALQFSGRFLYAGTAQGAFVIDVSQPIEMRTITSLVSGNINEYVPYGNYAFVSGNNLVSILHDNIRTPRIVNSSAGIVAGKPAVEGYRVVLPLQADGVRIMDIRDIENPVLYPGYTGCNPAMAVALKGNFAISACGSQGMKILDISDPTNPILLSTLPSGDFFYDVALSGESAFLTDGSQGLKIVDISELTTPQVTGTCAPSSCLPPGVSAEKILTSGEIVYLGLNNNSIAIVDVSDRTNPSLLKTVTTSDVPLDMALAGNYLYVAEGAPGIEIYFVSNPNFPVKAGSLAVQNNSATGIYISGKTLFVADGTSIHFADISSPSTPFIFLDYNLNALSIGGAGEFLIVPDGIGSIRIIDYALETFSYLSQGNGVSLNVNIQPWKVRSAKVVAVHTTGNYGTIRYFLSNDGGTNWMEVFSGGSLSNFSTEGSDLRWKAELQTSDRRRTPVVDKIEVYYK